MTSKNFVYWLNSQILVAEQSLAIIETPEQSSKFKHELNSFWWIEHENKGNFFRDVYRNMPYHKNMNFAD